MKVTQLLQVQKTIHAVFGEMPNHSKNQNQRNDSDGNFNYSSPHLNNIKFNKYKITIQQFIYQPFKIHLSDLFTALLLNTLFFNYLTLFATTFLFTLKY
jgi:hypothetical protein